MSDLCEDTSRLMREDRDGLLAAVLKLVDRDAAIVGAELRLNFESHCAAFDALHGARRTAGLQR